MAGENLEGFSENVAFKLGLEVQGDCRKKPEGSSEEVVAGGIF